MKLADVFSTSSVIFIPLPGTEFIQIGCMLIANIEAHSEVLNTDILVL